MAFENFREYKYHFTSCAGLYGMLQGYSKNNPNLTMWATHSSFMNDPTEYEHGKEMCLRVFESYEKKLGTYKTDISIFKMGRKQISDFMTKEAPFLISLSGNIESAAMWSMYSSNGSGIALKFDVATLQKHALLKDNDSIEPTVPQISLKNMANISKFYMVRFVNHWVIIMILYMICFCLISPHKSNIVHISMKMSIELS